MKPIDIVWSPAEARRARARLKRRRVDPLPKESDFSKLLRDARKDIAIEKWEQDCE